MTTIEELPSITTDEAPITSEIISSNFKLTISTDFETSKPTTSKTATPMAFTTPKPDMTITKANFSSKFQKALKKIFPIPKVTHFRIYKFN
ncbi:hypothetical protein PGB90_005435 [Kerria lacca]